MAHGRRGSWRPALPGPREDALAEFFAGDISAGEFWRRVSQTGHRPEPGAGGSTASADARGAAHPRQKARRAWLAALVAAVAALGSVGALLVSGAVDGGSRTPRPTGGDRVVASANAHRTRTHVLHHSAPQAVSPRDGSAATITTQRADPPVARGRGTAAAHTLAAGKGSSHGSARTGKRPTSTTTTTTVPTTPTSTTPTTPTTTTPTTATTPTTTTPTPPERPQPPPCLREQRPQPPPCLRPPAPPPQPHPSSATAGT